MHQTTVKDWMKDLVVFIDPDASVYEGLELMRHRYATSLIVVKTDTNPVYGIVTSINICDKIVAHHLLSGRQAVCKRACGFGIWRAGCHGCS